MDKADEIPVDPVLIRTKILGKYLVEVVQSLKVVEARVRNCNLFND